VTDRRRRRAAIALVVATTLLLAGAAVSWYAQSALVDSREFGARAASALDDSDVRDALAERIVDGITSGPIPDALAVRPLVVPVIASLADTSAFRRVFADALRQRHEALVEGERTFQFRLAVGDGLLFDALMAAAPNLAERIPPGLRVPVIRLDPRQFELDAARLVVDLAGWRWPLLVLALLAGTGTALLAGGARNALVSLGVAAAGAGLLVAALVAGLGEFVVSHAASAADIGDGRERAAIRALWDALFADLRDAGLVAALAGAVVAALAARGMPRARTAAARRLAERALSSQAPAAKLARAAVLVTLGGLLIFEPGLFGRILLVTAGIVIVLAGVAQLSGEESAPDPVPSPRTDGVPARLLAGVVAVTLALAVLGIALLLPSPGQPAAGSAVAAGGCNGSRALCGKRLGEVVFPATHNSYAAADEPGWLFANQRLGIERQLRDGIRAFLIDIHWGAPDASSGLVRTDFEAEGTDRNKVARELGPEALRAADALVGRAGVGRPTTEPRPYLCHTLCEIGSEPLEEQLQLFSDFLRDNRREVVILFVEPYVPVEETERAMEATGLLEQAAELSVDEPLPTLGQLIRANTRLIVFSEEDGGARPWYLPGFEFAQDTPLGAERASELSCARFRGDADSPLFLLNHWIDTFPPSPSRNRRIGGRLLERRVDGCERARGLRPNLLAVDFYERSGVIDVARRLNAG